MNDSPDTEPDTTTSAGTSADGEPRHPLQRAHRFFLKAAPVIREVNDTIERHGGLEQVREKVVERAGELVRQVDDVVANVTAIEGEVIERPSPADATGAARTSARRTPLATPVQPPRSPVRWIAIGVVAAAATYGALRLQRRS